VLSELEAHLRELPPGYAPYSAYRKWCAEHDRHNCAIEFLEELVDAHTQDTRLRLEYASAYIDKIPTCGGVTGLVARGNLARKSLDQLDIVVKEHPDLWAAFYCRGMNHLHWPKALKHSDDAVADFNRCIALQQQSGRGNEKPWYLRTHIALGDAYAKDEQFEKARQVWKEGLELFPGDEQIQDRLNISEDNELLDFVLSRRSLDEPVDTDLSFLDEPE
jgi:tetratricopeptide (TPR) repeat protein